MKTDSPVFMLLSFLLRYPQPMASTDIDQIDSMVNEMEPSIRDSIRKFLDYIRNTDLLSRQEEYTETLDRSASLSFYLFEHLMKDSRERGQAMVDLKETYMRHGLNLKSSELPDYLPVFLEYLSSLPMDKALDELSIFNPVIGALAERLKKKSHPHAHLIVALATLTNAPICDNAPATEASLDELWADDPVEFSNASCPSLKEKR